VIADIAGSTTKGIRKRKAKTERIAVVPTKRRRRNEFEMKAHRKLT
jgi:hypothetical protein